MTQEVQHAARVPRPKSHFHDVHVLLWVIRKYEVLITKLLSRDCEIPRYTTQRAMHLTVYHGRRPLPGLVVGRRSVQAVTDALKTRVMVLAPGGENPRPELELSRPTGRNPPNQAEGAIEQIRRVRASIYRLETPAVIGKRTPTSA